MMTSTPVFLTSMISGLLAMALLTLLERKMLSYSQKRKGPNKPSFTGLPQPLSDAIKLLSKEMILPTQTNKMFFLQSPLLMLLISLTMWSLLPTLKNPLMMKYSIIMFLCLSSMSVYSALGASWTSNSKYSLIGAARGVAQTISYEVSMALIMINSLMFMPNYNFNSMIMKAAVMFLVLNTLLTMLWFSSALAELNRAPFDLVEGESELVSGFNTEFSSGLFTMIFMAEYLNIMFMMGLTTILIINVGGPFFMLMLPVQATLASITIMLRSTLPRIRYDMLMLLNWVFFLPTTIISISMLSTTT